MAGVGVGVSSAVVYGRDDVPTSPRAQATTARRACGPGASHRFRHDDGVADERSAYVPNELLSRLVGFRLDSVEFVMDDVMPAVETPGGLVAQGQ